MTQIELSDVKEQLMELIERAASGEVVIIARDKKPLVKISSVSQPKHQRQFGSAKGLIIMHDDFDEPLEDFEEYMAYHFV
jgi:antitoxin (DNA-binding transcriptional repressor) of toxin-antitoxin stability system